MNGVDCVNGGTTANRSTMDETGRVVESKASGERRGDDVGGEHDVTTGDIDVQEVGVAVDGVGLIVDLITDVGEVADTGLEDGHTVFVVACSLKRKAKLLVAEYVSRHGVFLVHGGAEGEGIVLQVNEGPVLAIIGAIEVPPVNASIGAVLCVSESVAVDVLGIVVREGVGDVGDGSTGDRPVGVGAGVEDLPDRGVGAGGDGAGGDLELVESGGREIVADTVSDATEVEGKRVSAVDAGGGEMKLEGDYIGAGLVEQVLLEGHHLELVVIGDGGGVEAIREGHCVGDLVSVDLVSVDIDDESVRGVNHELKGIHGAESGDAGGQSVVTSGGSEGGETSAGATGPGGVIKVGLSPCAAGLDGVRVLELERSGHNGVEIEANGKQSVVGAGNEREASPIDLDVVPEESDVGGAVCVAPAVSGSVLQFDDKVTGRNASGLCDVGILEGIASGHRVELVVGGDGVLVDDEALLSGVLTVMSVDGELKHTAVASEG